jgi:endonuclease YncB( thermonuclease family)
LKASAKAFAEEVLAAFVVLTLALTAVGVAIAGVKPPPQATPAPEDASRPLTSPESGEMQIWGTVRAVVNGTSLVVVSPELTHFDVRLLGVEPPEPPRAGRQGNLPTGGQPFGPQAVTYARDLLLDKQVRLETHGKDRLGRIMAVVWLGDINVNLTLVKEGFAWVSPDISVARVRIELEVAERQAQVGKYGLWSLPAPEPPWEFRRRHRLPAE